MKKIISSSEVIYVGTAREIASLYKNLRDRELAIPTFSETPRFNPDRLYGLVLEEIDPILDINLDIPEMRVVTSDVVVSILLDL